MSGNNMGVWGLVALIIIAFVVLEYVSMTKRRKAKATSTVRDKAKTTVPIEYDDGYSDERYCDNQGKEYERDITGTLRDDWGQKKD